MTQIRLPNSFESLVLSCEPDFSQNVSTSAEPGFYCEPNESEMNPQIPIFTKLGFSSNFEPDSDRGGSNASTISTQISIFSKLPFDSNANFENIEI